MNTSPSTAIPSGISVHSRHWSLPLLSSMRKWRTFFTDADPTSHSEVRALRGSRTTGCAEPLKCSDRVLIQGDTGFQSQLFTGPSSLGETAQDGPRGTHSFRGHCFASLGPQAVCRECLVGGTGTFKQSLGPAARVFTDAKRTVSVSKCNMHRDQRIPTVSVVGVFVLFPPRFHSVVPPGLVPVPGLFGVSLLRLSLRSCLTCWRTRSIASGAKFPRKACGKRAPTQVPVPPSFFEAITKGRRSKNRALLLQVPPPVLTYGCWSTWRIPLTLGSSLSSSFFQFSTSSLFSRCRSCFDNWIHLC